MATNYTGDSSAYNFDISIFEPFDMVLGGLDGPSNVPVQQIADNSAHLKKYKGNVFQGIGAPSDAIFPVGFIIDANTNTNTLYLDTVTGSFWKRTGTNTWQNIGKGAILNVKGMRVNNAGNTSDTVLLRYNDAGKYLELRNNLDTDYADLRVKTILFDAADGETLEISKFVDQEILLLSGITNSASNQNAYFSIKQLYNHAGSVTAITLSTNRFTVSDVSGISTGDYIEFRGIIEGDGENINGLYRIASVGAGYLQIDPAFKPIDATSDKSGAAVFSAAYARDNSAQLKWDNTNSRWEFRRRDGSLLPIDVSGLFINGVSVQFVATRVIARQSDFDLLFNHLSPGGLNECWLRAPESVPAYSVPLTKEYIFIKKNNDLGSGGNYVLRRRVVVENSDNKIEFAEGVTVVYDTSANTNVGFCYRSWTDFGVQLYKNNKFVVPAKSYYYTGGDYNNSTTVLPPMVSGDRIFAFCDDSALAKRYTVTSHVKAILSDALLGTGGEDIETVFTSIDITDVYDAVVKTVGANTYLFIAYVDNANSNRVTLIRFTYDWATNGLSSAVSVSGVLGAGFSSPTELKIAMGTGKLAVVGSIPSGSLVYAPVDVNTMVVGSPHTGSSDVTAMNVILYADTLLYIVGQSSTSLVIQYCTLYGSITSQLYPLGAAAPALKSTGITNIGSKIYFSWGDPGDGNLYVGSMTGTGTLDSATSVQGVVAGQIDQGVFTQLGASVDPSNTGNHRLYLPYTFTLSTEVSVPNNASNIHMLVLKASDLSIESSHNIYNNGMAGIASLRLSKNDTNAFPSNGTDSYNITACRGDLLYVGGKGFISASWQNLATVTISGADGTNSMDYTTLDPASIVPAGSNNDYILFMQKVGSFYSIMRLRFGQYVGVLETIPLGITAKVLLSNDYIQNCSIVNLKATNTINNGSFGDDGGAFIHMGNTVNCKALDCSFRDSAMRQFHKVISGTPADSQITNAFVTNKNHNASVNNLEVQNTVDATDFVTNFSHSNVLDFVILATPLTTQFLNCIDMNMQGVENDGKVIVLSGYANF